MVIPVQSKEIDFFRCNISKKDMAHEDISHLIINDDDDIAVLLEFLCCRVVYVKFTLIHLHFLQILFHRFIPIQISPFYQAHLLLAQYKF